MAYCLADDSPSFTLPTCLVRVSGYLPSWQLGHQVHVHRLGWLEACGMCCYLLSSHKACSSFQARLTGCSASLNSRGSCAGFQLSLHINSYCLGRSRGLPPCARQESTKSGGDVPWPEKSSPGSCSSLTGPSSLLLVSIQGLQAIPEKEEQRNPQAEELPATKDHMTKDKPMAMGIVTALMIWGGGDHSCENTKLQIRTSLVQTLLLPPNSQGRVRQAISL